MVKGAQSTVSDKNGSFVLHFSTLKPGDKVDYTEIYKQGFVIFNKDAVDTWRISNSGRPFTIIMCKESDFRALKKKFYGIIEKSYYNEYVRQKALAEKSSADLLSLNEKLKSLEDEYQRKMSNINSYVELFSRIDQSEMDSIEARAIEYMEQGQIEDAIRIYEELQLRKEVEVQFSKWDAADEMHRVADRMSVEVQEDLVALVGKMQKQISLYQMGGEQYDIKRYDAMDDLIRLLWRLVPATEGVYEETLGNLIIERAQLKPYQMQFEDFRKAASIPSIVGIENLTKAYEGRYPSKELNDSIRQLYHQAIGMIGNPSDSISLVLEERLSRLPERYFVDSNGIEYPYRVVNGEEVMLTGRSPYYSVVLEGEVTLPSEIEVEGRLLPVTAIGEFAFGNNSKLKKIILPKHCKTILADALRCDSLTVVVNAELDSVSSSNAIPIDLILEFPETPKHHKWILQRINDIDNSKNKEIFKGKILDPTACIEALTRYFTEVDDKESALYYYNRLIPLTNSKEEYDVAKQYAIRAMNIDRHVGYLFLSYCNFEEGDIDSAIKNGEKSLTPERPVTYNKLIYYIIDPRVVKPDYKKAHKLADKCIEILKDSPDRAFLIDTKGVIYLREGKLKEAKQHLDLAMSINQDAVRSGDAELFLYFNPELANMSEEEREAIEIERYRKRNVGISLMAFDYVKNRMGFSENIEWNEISKEVLDYVMGFSPRDKELKCPATYCFYLAVMRIGQYLYAWSQKNQIQYENEWIGYMNSDSRYMEDFNLGFQTIQLIGARVIRDNLPCNLISSADARSLELKIQGLAEFRRGLSPERKALLDEIMEGHDIGSLISNFEINQDSIVSLVKEIGSYLDCYRLPDTSYPILECNLQANRYDDSVASLLKDYDERDKNKHNLLRAYVELSKTCAHLEMKEIPFQDNLRMPTYEEFLAIGIVASSELLRKPAQEVAKFKTWNVATVMRWALRNEIKIRYPWYYLFVSPMGGYDAQYEQARLYNDAGVEYRIIKRTLDILDTMRKLWETSREYPIESYPNSIMNPKEEIEGFWKTVVNLRESVPQDLEDCYDYIFFSENPDIGEIDQRFSPILIGRLNDFLKGKFPRWLIRNLETD